MNFLKSSNFAGSTYFESVSIFFANISSALVLKTTGSKVFALIASCHSFISALITS